MVSRRWFLLVTSGVAGWIATRRWIGLVPRQKPPLTGPEINRYIATTEREDEATRLLLAAEVKRDLLSFLDQRFAVSTAQRRRVEMLTVAERQQIRLAVEGALRPGWRLIVRTSATRGGNRSVVTMTTDTSRAGRTVVLWWPCLT